MAHQVYEFDEYFVLNDGKVIANKVFSECIQFGVKETSYYVDEDDMLCTMVHCHTDDGFARHSWSELGSCLGKVKYTYSSQDIKEAEFLILMEKYFPNIKPSKVSAVTKYLVKKLKKEK